MKKINLILVMTGIMNGAMLALVTSGASQSLSSLNGSWSSYFDDGRLMREVKLTLRQAGSFVAIEVAENGKSRTINARIDGATFTMGGETTTGTISADGNRIRLTDGTYWQKSGTSDGAASIDLTGSWTGFYANGTKAPHPGTIRHTGASVLIDNGEGGRSNGRIEGTRIIATDWNLTGTIVCEGRRINWSNNTMWIKNSLTPAPLTTLPSLTGAWSKFYDDGRLPIATMMLRQTGNALTAEITAHDPAGPANAANTRQTVTGRIEGTRFFLAGETGLVEENGTRIKMSNNTHWVRRDDLPLNANTPNQVSPAPPSANLDQQCFQAIQGKVAWNRAGNTTWEETNIRNLCKGTANPSGTIACFQNQIRQHDQWGQAIKVCSALSSGAASLPVISGNWRGYYEDGSLSPFVWVVGQNGAALTFADIGAGSNRRTTARLQNAQSIEADWGTTGRLSPDGKSIRWSDKTIWVLIPNLNGTWIGYYEDGSKSPFVWAVRQSGATITVEDIGAGSGRKSKGRVENNQVIAEDWNLTATISSDGKRITWANGTFWTPQNR